MRFLQNKNIVGICGRKRKKNHKSLQELFGNKHVPETEDVARD